MVIYNLVPGKGHTWGGGVGGGRRRGSENEAKPLANAWFNTTTRPTLRRSGRHLTSFFFECFPKDSHKDFSPTQSPAGKMCSCFSNLAGEQLLPTDDYPPRRSQTPQPQLQSKMPKRTTTTKQIAKADDPSSQRTSQSSEAPPATHITGRRSRGASASHSSLPTSTAADRRSDRRSDDPTGNMLYFGTGLSPEQAMKVYKSPTPVSHGSSSSSAAGKSATAAAGNASGRDASGYLPSSVGSTNGMNGTYSSLTYGGSLQYNYAGSQNYGAGSVSPAGNGLM